MATPKPRRGVIYVLHNPAYRGILKIGLTERDTKTRARELSSPSGVPEPFEVVYDAVVSDAALVEREIHDKLRDVRVNKSREFFRIGMREAIEVVQDAAKRYPADPQSESVEIDILPGVENRMRRWLRRDLVGLKFVQYPDLCLLKMTFQPKVSSTDAYEKIFDLSILGDDPEVYPPDQTCVCDPDQFEECKECAELLFNPFLRSATENSQKFIDELDVYSMLMVHIGIINTEADEYVGDLVERKKVREPMFPQWTVVGSEYDIRLPRDRWPAEFVENIAQSHEESSS